MTFVLDRVTKTRPCRLCPRRFECQLLSELALVPMLCERVSEDDLMLAELHRLVLDVLEGREWVNA